MERIKVENKSEMYKLNYKSVSIEIVMSVDAAGADFCDYFDSCLCCPFALKYDFCNDGWRRNNSLLAIYKVSFDDEGYPYEKLISVETDEGIIVGKDGVPHYSNGERVPKGTKIKI